MSQKKTEREILAEMFQEVCDLNDELRSESKELDSQCRVSLDNFRCVAEIFNVFEGSTKGLLDEEVKRQQVQLSLSNVKVQKDLLMNYFNNG